MKEGEVIYMMYNHSECDVPTTPLLAGNEHGKENWSRRNNRQDPKMPKHITIWINKDQLITSSFIVGFLSEFANNKTMKDLIDAVAIKVTGSYTQDEKEYISKLQRIAEEELNRALVRICAGMDNY